MNILQNKLTIFCTRFCLYGAISCLLGLFTLGLIKKSHEALAIEAMKSLNQSGDSLFSLSTPDIMVFKKGQDADYFRGLTSRQLGGYLNHELNHWTADFRSLLSAGILPIDLYYKSTYENGESVHSIRVEGVFEPKLISHSVFLDE